MKEKRKDFIDILQNLCDIYKDYIKKNNDSRLEVYINNNMIKMYLYKGNDVVDQFGLAFNHKEKDSYMYVSIVLMKMLFGNGIIYNKDNVFYENIDGTGFRMVVNDHILFEKMFDIVNIHRDIDFYNKIDKGGIIRNKVNRYRSADNLDERVKLTRKLLKIRSMK